MLIPAQGYFTNRTQNTGKIPRCAEACRQQKMDEAIVIYESLSDWKKRWRHVYSGLELVSPEEDAVKQKNIMKKRCCKQGLYEPNLGLGSANFRVKRL